MCDDIPIIPLLGLLITIIHERYASNRRNMRSVVAAMSVSEKVIVFILAF